MSAGIALQIPAAFIEAVARRAAVLVLEQLGDRTDAPDTPWMEQEEAADYLRIKHGTFKKLVTARRIPVHPEGRRNYFHRDELDRWRLDQPVGAIAA